MVVSAGTARACALPPAGQGTMAARRHAVVGGFLERLVELVEAEARIHDLRERIPAAVGHHEVQRLHEMARVVVVNALQGDPLADQVVAVQREVGVRIDQPGQHVAPADAQHPHAARHHRGHSANLQHHVRPVRRRCTADRRHQRVLAHRAHVEGEIGPEPFGGPPAGGYRIEPDHPGRAPGLRDGAAVDPQQPQALYHHRLSDRDPGRLGDRDHGGHPAVERGRLLVGERVRQLQDAGAGQDVAVVGEAAQEVGVVVHVVVAVLAKPRRLLRHVVHVAVVRRTVGEVLGPGDAVADCERVAAPGRRLRAGRRAGPSRTPSPNCSITPMISWPRMPGHGLGRRPS